jgi:hypothetical protein
MLDDIERWVADARADEAAGERVRERWLRQQAEEDASFAGVLLDLAERGLTVTVTGVSGRRHQGRVAALGADFVALRTETGRLTLLALDAVARVRLAPPARGVSGSSRDVGDRSREVTLGEVLAQAAGHRPRLSVHCGADHLLGQLRAVGADVLSLAVDDHPTGMTYARLGSVSEISFLDSG